MQPARGIPGYLLAILGLFGWFALLSQFYLIIEGRVVSVPETIIRYFSFFTILTNLLVAVCATVLLLKPGSAWGRFFARATTGTAIAVYIVIVGVVYNTVLRFLWKPQGLQYVVDELLHSVIPVLYFLCWVLFVPKSSLQYKHAFGWLIYPAVYLCWILIYGALSGYYPYPFVNVVDLGYDRVLINCAGLFLAFLGLSLFLILLAKFLSRNKN